MPDSHSAKTTEKAPFFSYFSLGKNPGRIPELDGLRAWAIIMVLGHHFATFYREQHGSYYRHTVAGPFENWLLNGWLGVDLFFVLSGYLIFRHLMSIEHNKLQQQSPKRFFLRYGLKRVLRTFPLYYAMILVALFGLIPQFSPNISSADLWIHLLFLQDYLGSDILTPMWSLATEEKFYLLAPLLLFLSRWSLKKSLKVLLVTMVVIIVIRTAQIIGGEPVANHIQFFEQYRAPFHFALVSILVGVMVALSEQRRVTRTLPLLMLFAVLVLLVLLWVFNWYQVKHWSLLSVIHFVIVLLFGFVVWAAIKLQGSRWLRLLTGRFLRVVSVLSYSLYLVHYAVLPWVYSLHKQHVYSEVAWVHAGSFLLLYLAMTLAVSLVLHYVVEKPFLLLKDKL